MSFLLGITKPWRLHAGVLYSGVNILKINVYPSQYSNLDNVTPWTGVAEA